MPDDGRAGRGSGDREETSGQNTLGRQVNPSGWRGSTLTSAWGDRHECCELAAAQAIPATERGLASSRYGGSPTRRRRPVRGAGCSSETHADLGRVTEIVTVLRDEPRVYRPRPGVGGRSRMITIRRVIDEREKPQRRPRHATDFGWIPQR